MSIFSKAFDDIDESDIKELVEQREAESYRLDFKRQAYDRTRDKKELRCDVTAMANASGGYLLLGVEEDVNNRAEKIVSVPAAETEAEWTEKVWSTGIEPRIPGIRQKVVKTSEGDVIVIFVARSTRAPHMVSFDGDDHFYIRHGTNRHHMTLDEIRDAFHKSYHLLEDLDHFLGRRREEHLRSTKPTLVVGAGPMSMREEVVNIHDERVRELLRDPPKVGSGVCGWADSPVGPRPTLHGLEISNEYKRLAFFRSAYLELSLWLSKLPTYEGKDILPCALARYIVSFMRLLKPLVEHHELGGPIFASVALYNIRNWKLQKIGDQLKESIQYSDPWSESDPHCELGTISTDSLGKPDVFARAICDRIWNAFHFEECPLFTSNEAIREWNLMLDEPPTTVG